MEIPKQVSTVTIRVSLLNTISFSSEPCTSKPESQSTEYEKVMTSSNSAYGVVSANDDHEYEVIGLPQMDTHHMSTT